LRIFVGVIFLRHFYQHFFVFGPAGLTGYMEKVAKVPAPAVVAWIVMIMGGIGGIMLILGLFTRWAAAANVLHMLGALFFVKFAQGFLNKGIIVDAAAGRAASVGYELELLLLAASLALALTGGGALAIKDR
jgi:uncharacterized membrane protein YphA (DoxX/SURF4 family)